jgi:phosphatidylglycerophosphatase A
MSLLQRVTLAVATGFGLGYAPVASGTFGTLAGVPLALALARWHTQWGWQAAAAAALTLLAVPVCGAAERHFGS